MHRDTAAGRVVAIVLGDGLLLSRRQLTAWNARGADAMKNERVRRLTPPDDGAPGVIVGIGVLSLVGAVLMVIGAVQL